MSETKIGYKDILKQKEYMKMIFAALINRFGDAIDAVASAWIVYELTNNAAWSAIIFGVNRLPSVLITPLAGAWVEGQNKKKIMIITDLIRAICVAFVATGYFLGFLQVWMLLITTFTISTAEAFRMPANTAFTPLILKKEYYEYAMSLMTTMSMIVELIGTALAATIIAVIGTAGAIYVDMVTFVLSAVIICFVNVKEEKKEKQKFQAAQYKQTLQDGLQYVSSNSYFKLLLFICIFLNAALVPLDSLQAPMANEILGGGAEILSVYGVATTLGMLIGSAAYPMLVQKVRANVLILVGGESVGLYYLAMILCQPFYSNKIFLYVYVVVSNVILGLLVAMMSSFMNVAIVKQTDQQYLARVSAIMSATACAAIPVTSFVVSFIAAWTSVSNIFILAGIVDMILILLMVRGKNFDRAKEESCESGGVEIE